MIKMQYKFTAYGHENVRAKHKTTLEFTKDKDLTPKGDCIVGVKADFSLNQLKKFIKSLKTDKIKIIIELKDKKIKEEIITEINPDFNSDGEMVIRKSDFRDERTFAVGASKAASDLDRDFVDKLKDNGQRINIKIKE